MADLAARPSPPAHHRHSRRPGARGKLALLGFGLLLAFVAAEVVLRLDNPFGFRMRGNVLVLPRNTTYVIEADPTRRSDQLEARVVHHKNSLGFRGPEPPADFAQRLTLVAVGGSTTECFYLSDGKTWPDRLSAKLEEELEGTWLDNAGLDGHSTFGHLLLLDQQLLALRPRYIVVLAGLNDMFADAPRDLDRVALDPVALLAEHSEVVALGLNLWRARHTARQEDLGTMPKPTPLRDRPRRAMSAAEEARLLAAQQGRLEAYRERLARLITRARGGGIEPVLLTQPTVLGEVDPRTGIDLREIEVEVWETVNGAVAWHLLERYNDVMRQLAREQEVLVVDVARSLPKDSRLFYDFFHLTNEGAEALATLVDARLSPFLMRRHPDRVRAGAVPPGEAAGASTASRKPW